VKDVEPFVWVEEDIKLSYTSRAFPQKRLSQDIDDTVTIQKDTIQSDIRNCRIRYEWIKENMDKLNEEILETQRDILKLRNKHRKLIQSFHEMDERAKRLELSEEIIDKAQRYDRERAMSNARYKKFVKKRDENG
jgi:uncharacterized coiled-coil protein SlyX